MEWGLCEEGVGSRGRKGEVWTRRRWVSGVEEERSRGWRRKRGEGGRVRSVRGDGFPGSEEGEEGEEGVEEEEV